MTSFVNPSLWVCEATSSPRKPYVNRNQVSPFGRETEFLRQERVQPFFAHDGEIASQGMKP